ncbi:riboflavin kinase [Microbacter sp. GSS18]|nr:riboflavin kinase [Microbacter sp. GSS18]
MTNTRTGHIDASPADVATVHTVGDAAAVVGTVVVGDQRGRDLGFPTANLLMGPDTRVEDGVWAAEVHVENRRYIAAVSLGHRPTYYGDEGVRLLEAHLLDFSGDLYGRMIVVHLRRHLRPQRRFGSTVALIRQMRRDVDGVRRWAQTRERQPVRLRRQPPTRTPDGGQVFRDRPSRRSQRECRIAAAVQHSIARGELTHERVAELAQVPYGFIRWAYPTLDDLRGIAGTVEVTHPY